MKLQYKPIHVMKTGFSLGSFSHREKPVFIAGVPSKDTGFSLCGKTSQGKPCFHPVIGCANKDLKGLCAPIFIIVVYSRTATSYFFGAKE